MELIVVDTRSGKRRSIPSGWDNLVLGRGFECDIVLPHDDVAELACRATRRADGVVLEALDGRGFALNDRPAQAAFLHAGDVVRFGPFQIVAVGDESARGGAGSAESEPPDDAPLTEAELAAIEARAARDREFAARRRRRRRNESALGVGMVVVMLGGLVVLWQQGVFGDVLRSGSGAGDPETAAGPEVGRGSNRAGAPGPDRDPGALPLFPESGSAEPSPAASGGESATSREPSSPEVVAQTLAKVDRLLELGEFARCRWLLWQLAPSDPGDAARVAQRRVEVDAAANEGGAEHLAFVDELLQKGKLAVALSHCEDDAIDRFRGLEAWYRLLEKADEIEAILNERVPESQRRRTTTKRARTMPPDLASRPPPAAGTSFSEEFEEAARGLREAAEAAKRTGGAPPERETEEPGAEPADPAAPAAETPPTPEQLAAAAAVATGLAELDAAKPSAFGAVALRLAESARAAGRAAIEPLRARCEEIATALEQAPERADLAELRERLLALRDARAEALAFLSDEARYFMLDPKAPGDAGAERAKEKAAAQKEADRLVGAVRKLWGSELGGAPPPQVRLSDATVRLVEQVRVLDPLLAELGAGLPDRTELLATRLLPLWAPRVTIRSLALDLDERARLDRDREIEARNQQVKEVAVAEELELVFATNSYRAMLGLPHVEWSESLAETARAWSRLRAKDAKAPKDDEDQPYPRTRDSDGRNCAGANYLLGKFSARAALQAWCRIPAAHRNVLHRDHAAMGAGKVGLCWTQEFGLLSPKR